MNDDILKILLSAQLDNKNLTNNINNQLKQVEAKINKLNIDINIKDADAFKIIENLNKEFAKLSQAKGNTSVFKGLKNDIDLANKSIKDLEIINSKTFLDAKGDVYKYAETVKQAGLSITETFADINKKTSLGMVFDDKSAEYEAQQSIKNAKEQLKAEESIQNAIALTIKRREEENRLLEERQSYYINKNLESNSPLVTDVSKAYTEATKLNKIYDEQSAKLKTLKGTFSELKGEQTSGVEVARKLSEIYGGLEIRGYSLDKITGAYNVQLKMSAKENLNLVGTLEKVNGALSVQNEKVTQAKNVQLGFWEQMKIAMQRVPIWMGATTVYFQGAKFAKDTITEIRSLNKEMIDLEKVSSASADELSRFYKEAPQSAKSLGVLTSEVINITAQISKLGYSLSDSQYLSNLSLIAKSVGDLSNTDDAVAYLTSTIKGFRLETEETAGILDYMNHTANTTSIDFQGIGEGFKRMSASMAEGNNSIQESMGLLVAGYDITRDSERTATALRTISLRLRAVSEDGEDLSNLVPDLEGKFNKFGLSLKKDNDTLKSTFEIFKDLATVYDQMSDMERASILEDISGKRSAQVASAIIQNMQKAIEVSESFEESQGSALLEHQKYMEGVEAAQNKFNSSMTMLHNQLLESGSIVWFYDMSSTIVDNVSALGKFSIVIAMLTVALGMFSIANRKAIKDMTDLQIVSNIGGLKKFGIDIGNSIKMLLGMKTATTATTISVTALNVATSALLLGIPLIAQGIGMWINRQKELKEELDESLQAFKSQTQLSNSLDPLIKSYEDLASKTTLTKDEQEKLLKVKNQIVALLPESKTALDNENLSLADQLEIVKDLNEEELKRTKRKAQDTLANFGQDYDKNFSKMRKAYGEMINYEKEIAKEYEQNGVSDRYETLNKLLNKSTEDYTELKEIIDSVDAATAILDGTTDGLVGTNENLDDTIGDLGDSFGNTSDQVKTLYENIETAVNKYDLFEQAMLELNTEGKLSEETFADLIKIIPDLIEVTGLETGALMDLLSQSGNTRVGVIMNELAKSDAVLSGTLARIKAYEEEAKALESITNATALAYGEKSLLMGYAKYTADKGKIEQLRSDIAGRLNGLIGNKYSPKTSKKDSTSSSTAKEILAQSDRYEKLNLQLELYNTLLSKNKTLQDLAGDDIDKKLPLMEEEIQLTKQRQIALHNLNEERRAELIELEKSLSGEGFTFEGADDSRIISNLDAIEGKTDKVEEQFKRYIELQSNLLPSASQEWWNLENTIQGVTSSLDDLLEQHRELARQDYIAKQNKLYEDQQKRLSALESIQEAIVSIIRKRGEEEQKALDLAHQSEMDSLEERHNKRKENYAKDLDDYRKFIQDKLDALSDQYEEEDYIEGLNKEREEATRIQKQIDVLSLDNSLTAKNKTIELRKQLSDQNEKIAKMQLERERRLTKDSLEDQLDEFEESISDKEKIADDVYNNEKKRLEEDYRINKEYLDKKYSDENVYAEARKSIMRGQVEVAEGVFMDIYDAYEDFEDKFGKGMGILGDIIKNDFINQLKEAQDAIDEMDYKASNLRKQIDSDYNPSDDEMDYKPPRPPKDRDTDKSDSDGIYMSKSDFNNYKTTKQIWEMAKASNDQASMTRMNEMAIAMRKKYGIKSDKYSYDDLKNLTYDTARFLNGGKLTQTGTGIIDIHGSKTSPEWIFNDAQLKKILTNVVSTTLNTSTPKLPSVASKQNIVLQIDNLINVEGNVSKETIPLIKDAGNKVMEDLQKVLNKNGVFRPVKAY